MHSLFILIPLFSVIILSFPFKNLMRKIGFWFVLGLAIAQIIFVLILYLNPLASTKDALSLFFNFHLSADNLSLVLLLSIGIVLATALCAAKQMIKSENRLFIFSNMMLAIACGMNGVVLVTDIFSLYVFMEITAVASFILIAFFKDIDALEGAFKYIMLSAFATALMLVSISLILLVSGSTGFSDISSALKVSQNAFPIMFAISIFIVGLFIKAGLMPFHGWLPDAYSSAPAPVSVLLAGIVTKTVGVYTLMRLTISVFGFSGPIQHVFLLVATISIVLAALAAIGQTDFKRMLAYSSISQIGYIILGLGCATPLGIAGAIFHLFNHAIFKSLLFVNAASVESQAGTRDMTKMGGLAAKMPVTGATSILASLSAAGVPPMAGFWSKLMIITALWVSGNRVYAVIAILASVITLGYFLYMQRTVFFGKLNQEFKDIKEAGWGLIFPSIMLGAIILAVGFVFPFLWKWGG